MPKITQLVNPESEFAPMLVLIQNICPCLLLEDSCLLIVALAGDHLNLIDWKLKTH